MKIEKTQVFGFGAALRGMRNPLGSHNKIDSKIIPFDIEYWKLQDLYPNYTENPNSEGFILGNADKQLAQKLVNAGSEHCKFLRQIQVWVDLTLPRYIWSEFDTYHYNTKNSESTMHTAHKRYLVQEDFEQGVEDEQLMLLNNLITLKNNKEISADEFIRRFKNMLPEGFLQMRTVNTNYAELLNIYRQRNSHRLKEWHTISDWILSLPYFKELTGL